MFEKRVNIKAIYNNGTLQLNVKIEANHLNMKGEQKYERYNFSWWGGEQA